MTWRHEETQADQGEEDTERSGDGLEDPAGPALAPIQHDEEK